MGWLVVVRQSVVEPRSASAERLVVEPRSVGVLQSASVERSVLERKSGRCEVSEAPSVPAAVVSPGRLLVPVSPVYPEISAELKVSTECEASDDSLAVGRGCRSDSTLLRTCWLYEMNLARARLHCVSRDRSIIMTRACKRKKKRVVID